MPPELTKFLDYKPFGGSDEAITVANLALVLLLVLAGYAVGRLCMYILKRRLAHSKLGADAVQAISRVAFWLIIVLVFLTALSLLQIPLTAFAFVTGAVAIGVGFGAQNILNNFISGWILMTEKPIRIDDFVEIDGMHGVVEGIGNRSTRIRRVDGVHLLVPNSSLLERNVINWTLVDRAIRSTVRVGVAYGSPVRKVAELIDQAVREHCRHALRPEAVAGTDHSGNDEHGRRQAMVLQDRECVRVVVLPAVVERDRAAPLRQRPVVARRIHPVGQPKDIEFAFDEREVRVERVFVHHHARLDDAQALVIARQHAMVGQYQQAAGFVLPAVRGQRRQRAVTQRLDRLFRARRHLRAGSGRFAGRRRS